MSLIVGVRVILFRYLRRKIPANLWPVITFAVFQSAGLFPKCLSTVCLQGLVLFLVTTDNQFGFKNATGCSHAIYIARSVIDHYTLGGSTILLISLPRISLRPLTGYHFGLFLKLMNRRVPNMLLSTLQNWLTKCYTCVRWCSAWSSFF